MIDYRLFKVDFLLYLGQLRVKVSSSVLVSLQSGFKDGAFTAFAKLEVLLFLKIFLSSFTWQVGD